MGFFWVVRCLLGIKNAEDVACPDSGDDNMVIDLVYLRHDGGATARPQAFASIRIVESCDSKQKDLSINYWKIRILWF